MRWMSRQGPPQWAGTNLVFTHEGFARIDEVYEATRGNWRYFLDSLKSYLETGQATPGTPPFVTSDRSTLLPHPYSSWIFCSVSSASSTCRLDVNCEKKMRRTIPCLSMMYVTRPGNPKAV